MFAEHDDGYAVIAANAGNDRPPAWSLNLAATGRATVVYDGRRIPVTARRAQGVEQEQLWHALARRYTPLPAYLHFTSRQFPIWVLEPTAR